MFYSNSIVHTAHKNCELFYGTVVIFCSSAYLVIPCVQVSRDYVIGLDVCTMMCVYIRGALSNGLCAP